MLDEALESLEEAQDNSQQEPSDETETSQEAERRYSDSDYEELRTKFNQRDEEVSEARSLKELADELGFTPAELAAEIRKAQEGQEEDLDEEEYEDPGQKALTRLEQLENELTQRQEQEAFDEQIADDVEELEDKEGIEFSDHTLAFFKTMAYQGVPPAEVFKDYLPSIYQEGAAWSSQQKEKKAQAASAPKGSPGTREEKLDTDDKRVAALTREIEQARHSQEA